MVSATPPAVVEGSTVVDAAVHSSEKEDYYTPWDIFIMAQEVMGGIDLDPCADPLRRCPAMRHYTKEDDGLSLPWKGRVFMNPPYGRQVGQWTSRFLSQHAKGWMTEGVGLIAARTDTVWFRPFHKTYVCYTYGRLMFLDEHYDEKEAGAPFPSAVVYQGPNLQKFIDVFSRIGAVVPPAIAGIT